MLLRSVCSRFSSWPACCSAPPKAFVRRVSRLARAVCPDDCVFLFLQRSMAMPCAVALAFGVRQFFRDAQNDLCAGHSQGDWRRLCDVWSSCRWFARLSVPLAVGVVERRERQRRQRAQHPRAGVLSGRPHSRVRTHCTQLCVSCVLQWLRSDRSHAQQSLLAVLRRNVGCVAVLCLRLCRCPYSRSS